MSGTEGERKYRFHWSLIGDIPLGRPNLGNRTRLEVFRLMQFCFRDVIEQHLGAAMTDRISYEAGELAGGHFYRNVVGRVLGLPAFLDRLRDLFREMGVGILRVEEVDEAAGRLILTISEDLDCSGLPELDYEACIYDEGFIAGLLAAFSGRRFRVREVDCWCTGDRTCRFVAEAEES
ncbi:MAG: V4R domain-containing protein [Desulfococcaceae bacterium]